MKVKLSLYAPLKGGDRAPLIPDHRLGSPHVPATLVPGKRSLKPA